jgi:hypothetical protein
MSDPEFFILKPAAWMLTKDYEDIMLGAFVQNYADPSLEGYLPRKTQPTQLTHHKLYSETKPVEGIFTEFVTNAYSEVKKEAEATLKSLVGVAFKDEAEQAAKLEGKLIRYKRLEQVHDFFKKVRKDKNVKAAVPGWITPSATVCLIVGIMMCEDVMEIELSSEERESAEGHFEVPISTITQAFGVPNPLGDTGDPGAKFARSQMSKRLFKAKSEGSKIFAVQLKPVTRGYIINRNKLKFGRFKKGDLAVIQGRNLDAEHEGQDEETIPDDELFLVE